MESITFIANTCPSSSSSSTSSSASSSSSETPLSAMSPISCQVHFFSSYKSHVYKNVEAHIHLKFKKIVVILLVASHAIAHSFIHTALAIAYDHSSQYKAFLVPPVSVPLKLLFSSNVLSSVPSFNTVIFNVILILCTHVNYICPANSCFHFFYKFLDVSSHLYMRVCRSVGPSVGKQLFFIKEFH